MIEKTKDGKFIPYVKEHHGERIIAMTSLINGEFCVVQCDTEEEAEQLIKKYRDFWAE